MINNLKFNIRTTFLFSISCLFCTDFNNINLQTNNITKPAETIVDHGISLKNDQTKDQQENTEQQNLVEKKKNIFYFLIIILNFILCFVFSFLMAFLAFFLLEPNETFLKKSLKIFYTLICKIIMTFFSLKLFSLNKKWIFLLKLILEVVCFFALFLIDEENIKKNFWICFFFCFYFIFFCIESLYVIALYKTPFFQNLKNNLVVFFSSFIFNVFYIVVFTLYIKIK